MDDMKEFASGVPGMLGALLTMIGAGIYAFRKFVRNDKVEGAATGAQVEIIDQLRTLLKEANERADVERKRADDAFAARNDALSTIGDLKAEIASLKAEIASLRKAVDNGKTV